MWDRSINCRVNEAGFHSQAPFGRHWLVLDLRNWQVAFDGDDKPCLARHLTAPASQLLPLDFPLPQLSQAFHPYPLCDCGPCLVCCMLYASVLALCTRQAPSELPYPHQSYLQLREVLSFSPLSDLTEGLLCAPAPGSPWLIRVSATHLHPRYIKMGRRL